MIKSSHRKGAPTLADDLEKEARSGDIDGADEWEGPLKILLTITLRIPIIDSMMGLALSSLIYHCQLEGEYE
jgi:hypothetical protein